ncbi:xanthine dehydrogenase accessory protein XdhC [Paenirhodobacter sp. CAU 1674]|uniref:xanthine dehydrogenase accessory protein XdhC n=1 Tax=Paenirhodobacter sp. CAU 1674 TaxID=3032596 RepID=UPI0023DA08D4|nr:xanthine dehydrogenase accessory protein XdhC [Paenirhodobacter sp. CAU 1674]MDF2141310.1 xanthine dehydrogenase accessory protein XdhC [Paenirhodobacter sp. CAU 1674]
MSLDPQKLAQAASRGPFVRVLVAEVRGSTPREAGAEMLVWPDRTEGTIGGGQLEFDAIARARSCTAPRLERIALGPAMGQCCGGAVTLAYEPLNSRKVATISGDYHARPMGDPTAPLALRRALARARDRGEAPPLLIGEWLVEPVAPPALPLWIWGAGHVGRAIVATLSPLPGLALSWADTAADRFPDIPAGVTPLIAENPADLVTLAPPDAHHLILTYSHALDLELCHRLLGHGFGACGLIGSASKWGRFRNRLRDLGHADAQISRIACPIGDPTLGKHPQAIAISVAAALLKETSATRAEKAHNQEGRAG